MSSGEERTAARRCSAFQRPVFEDVEARSERRATAENFRPEILEARET